MNRDQLIQALQDTQRLSRAVVALGEDYALPPDVELFRGDAYAAVTRLWLAIHDSIPPFEPNA
jgi:hypothetical protein